MPQRPSLCGQAIQKPSGLTLVFLLTVSLELLALVALTSLSLDENARHKHSAETEDAREAGLSYGTAVLLVTLAVWYFLVHGTLFERRLEVMIFVAASLCMMLFVIYQFVNPGADTSGLPRDARLARLTLVCASQPLNVVGGVIIVRNMDWLAFHLVGADEHLQRAYYVLTHFLGLVKLDLIVAIALLVLAAFSGLLSHVELGLCIAGVVLTLAWAFLAATMAKEERRRLAVPFFLVAVLEPAFIVYKFYDVATEWDSYQSLISGPLIVVGVLALLVRIAVVVYAAYVLKNFGIGIKQAYVRRHQAPGSVVNESGHGSSSSRAGRYPLPVDVVSDGAASSARTPLLGALGSSTGGPIDYGGIDDDEEDEAEMTLGSEAIAAVAAPAGH